jgi:thymidylate synthase (FAD)
MKAELVDVFGDDIMVVNAARVSLDKTSEWYEGQNFFWTRFGWMEWEPDAGVAVLVDEERVQQVLKEKDQKLIRYLAQHDHWSPFSHPKIQFRLTLPIFIARQWEKHRVGAVRGYDIFDQNEVSRRYVDDAPEFFRPDAWRARPDGSIKQGSGGELDVRVQYRVEQTYENALDTCRRAYETMLEWGVAPEQARMVLPVSHYTSWIETGSLLYWSRVANLRLDSHAQYEVSVLADQVSKHLAKRFPDSWVALVNDSEGDSK